MNRTKSTFTGCLLGVGLLLAAGESAHAVQAVWDNTWTPSAWTRGSTSGSLYAEWNIFSNENPNPAGNIVDTTPEVANFGGGAYRVEELTGTAFITSGGNIYSIGAPAAFDFTVTPPAGQGGPGLVRDFHMRLGTLGNTTGTPPQSFTNFTLNGLAGTYTHLFDAAIVGGFGGREVEALVSWLGVPHAPSYLLSWNAIGTAVSLDQLSLDVGPPVPLPAAAYLMASGLVGIAAMARRKQRAA